MFRTPWQLFDAWNTMDAGPTFFHCVDERLQCALLQDEELFVRMLVRRVRGKPRIQRRHVHFQFVERERGLPDNLARLRRPRPARSHGRAHLSQT
jgi:hypothetical protein